MTEHGKRLMAEMDDLVTAVTAMLRDCKIEGVSIRDIVYLVLALSCVQQIGRINKAIFRAYGPADEPKPTSSNESEQEP